MSCRSPKTPNHTRKRHRWLAHETQARRAGSAPRRERAQETGSPRRRALEAGASMPKTPSVNKPEAQTEQLPLKTLSCCRSAACCTSRRLSRRPADAPHSGGSAQRSRPYGGQMRTARHQKCLWGKKIVIGTVVILAVIFVVNQFILWVLTALDISSPSVFDQSERQLSHSLIVPNPQTLALIQTYGAHDGSELLGKPVLLMQRRSTAFFRENPFNGGFAISCGTE